VHDEVLRRTISLANPARTQKCRAYTIFPKNSLEWRRFTGEMTCGGSLIVVIRQELWLQNTQSVLASLSFQTLNLPKKLCRECRFTPKALIARVVPQAQLHVAGSRLSGSPEDAPLLFVQFKQQCGLCHECPHVCGKPDQ
jgi:hypothetical protein